MKELLKTLCALNGVSGDEDQVREFLAERARPWARSMKVDPLGNLIVWKKGARAAGDRLMLCAHMDSIGFIVTHIDKEGFLRVGKLGGISPKEAVYTPVRFKNGVRGCFLPEEKAEFGKLKLDECYLDIGAKNEA